MKQMVIGKKEWFGIVISGTHPRSNGIECVEQLKENLS